MYCLLVNKKDRKNKYYINKDRTILNYDSIGLSLNAFALMILILLTEILEKGIFLHQKGQVKIVNKKYRAGPNGNTI